MFNLSLSTFVYLFIFYFFCVTEMTPGQSYLITDYKATIESTYNITQLIACNTDIRTGANNTIQMFEIRFCVDLTANHFINCIWSVSRSCNSSPTSIAFPM
jgi:hypothetical protein